MPDSDDHTHLSQFPGYLLRRAAYTMMAELATRLAAHDLRISDATVMLLIGHRRDMTSSEIGKALDIHRANMVPLLNRLEASGKIERQAIDRKSQAIVLTATGLEKLVQVRALTERFESDLVDRIPQPHRIHLIPALQALIG